MKIANFFVAAALLAVGSLSIGAPAQLTKVQADQVDALVHQVEQACLNNTAWQTQKNESVRMVMKWASDPRVCSCQSTAFRTATTPAVFKMNTDDQREFYKNIALTKGAECSVPVIKEKIAESCEQFLGLAVNGQAPSPEMQKRMDSLGIADVDTYVAKVCGCLKPGLQKISTKEWVDSSMAAYNAYLERKRTGNNTITAPPTPIENMMNTCFSQIQAESKAAAK